MYNNHNKAFSCMDSMRITKHHLIPICTALAGLFLSPISAAAQDRLISSPVGQRAIDTTARDDFGQYPIHAGSFFISPSLTLEQQYDTNVFASQTDEQTDFVTLIRPSLQIQKQIRDQEFGLSLSSDIQRFFDETAENIENYRAEFRSRLIATRKLALPLGLSYRVNHRQRRQERSLEQSDAPLRYKDFRAEAGVEYTPNRLTLGLYGSYSNSRNDNGQTGNGAILVREDGDFDRYAAEARILYNTQTNWSPYAQLLVSQNDFKNRDFDGVGFNGLARDNFLIRARAGVNFDYKGLVIGTLALGQESRRYSDRNVSDINAFSAEANVEWKPREGTSLVFNLTRETDEDNEVNNGITETNASLALDYELLKDLFLTSSFEYENSEFETGNRTDDDYSLSLGVEYIINPRLSISGEVIQNKRESSNEGADFDQTVFLTRLTGSL